jgi:hypothetical protein
VRPVPGSLFDGFVMATESRYERMARAFQAGIVRIENLRMESGEVRQCVEMVDVKIKGAMATDEACYAIEAAARYEVGHYVEQISFLAKKTGLAYTVPPSSATVWERLPHLFAEKSQESAATSSDSPSQAAPAQSQEGKASALVA